MNMVEMTISPIPRSGLSKRANGARRPTAGSARAAIDTAPFDEDADSPVANNQTPAPVDSVSADRVNHTLPEDQSAARIS
jgi:hypothetical protein